MKTPLLFIENETMNSIIDLILIMIVLVCIVYAAREVKQNNQKTRNQGY